MQDLLCALCVIVGALFITIAGIGILRMPDLFMRMSCTTKATTLGTGFIMLAVAVKFPQFEVMSRALVITVFTFLTAPVAAHMIARAAYVSGVRLWDKTTVDQLCGRYDRCSCTLESCPITDDPEGNGPLPDRMGNKATDDQPADAVDPVGVNSE
ncbi:MAG: monovalent cation/H(+) antiporter subunit G [Syntrophobacteraceae bacterium]